MGRTDSWYSSHSRSSISPKKNRRARDAVRRCVDALEPRTYFTNSLGALVEYPGVSAPTAIVVGDFNNDGNPDIAVAGTNPNTSLPTVAIYLNSAGTFPTTPTYNDLAGAKSAFALVTTNINGGPNTDLAVTDPVDGTVLLLTGNGDGTFAAPISSTYGTPQPANSSPKAYIVSGPFTTGFQTLIVTDPADHQIIPLTSAGDGTYAPGTPITSTDANFSPEQIVAADFNQDGKYDIAFVDGTTAAVFEANGDGNGGFAAATENDVNGPVTGLVAADLTADGSTDLIATTATGAAGGGAVNVLLNSGGTFAAAGQFATTFADPGPVIAADIDGDGMADIVTMDSAGNLDFFHGNGDGSLKAAASSQPTQAAPTGLAAADFNNDVKSDVVFAESNPALTGGGGIGVMLGQTPPAFSSTQTGTLPASGIASQKIKLSQTVTFTNTTSSKITGTPIVELALSTSQSFSDVTAILATAKHPGTILPGKSKTVKVTATKIPADVPTGTYYVVAEVNDPSGGISTSSSAATINITAAQVDLSGAFKSLPAAAHDGRPIPTAITVKNAGNVPAIGVLPIAVYSSTDGMLDGTSSGLVGLNFRINIKPGKSATFHLAKVILPAAGTYYLVIDLDPNNTLGYIDTSNNTFASPVQVTVT